MSESLDVQIVRVTPENASLLDHVAADVFDEPVDRLRLANYLKQANHILLVAISGGEVVAQCAAVVHPHPDKATELYIDEVGVTPPFRRRGIARRLLDEMFAIGKSAGCEEAWVGTENENVAARRLYESRGAKPEPFVLYAYELLDDGASTTAMSR